MNLNFFKKENSSFQLQNENNEIIFNFKTSHNKEIEVDKKPFTEFSNSTKHTSSIHK